MAKARVSVKTAREAISDPELGKIFERMVGEGALDYQAVWPKYKTVRFRVRAAVLHLDWLADQEWLRTAFPEERVRIRAYVDQLFVEFETHFMSGPDLDRYCDPLALAILGDDEESRLTAMPQLSRVPPEELQAFELVYKGAMDSDLVNTLVVTCNSLTQYKSFIEDREKLNKRFLQRAGMSFRPIPRLPAANFRAFYESDRVSDRGRETIMVFLHELYHATHEVYEATSAPDMNVDEFVDIVLAAIDKIKHHIPRCDDAFHLLSNSVDLLKSNFRGYCRDMKHSGNPNVMMEHFVADVAVDSKTRGVRPRVLFQFRKIMEHFSKQQHMSAMTGEGRTLMRTLEKSMNRLVESHKGAEEEEEEEAAAGDSAAAAGDSAPAAGDSAAAAGAAGDSAAAAAAAGDADAAGDAEEESGEAPAGRTPAERAAHQKELARKRRMRADARRKAASSIKTHLAAGMSRLNND